MRRDPRIIRHPYTFAARPAHAVIAQPIAASPRPIDHTTEHSFGPLTIKRFVHFPSGQRTAQIKLGRSFINFDRHRGGLMKVIGYIITDLMVVSFDLPGWPDWHFYEETRG